MAALVSRIKRKVNTRLSGYASMATALGPVRDFRDRRYARELRRHNAALPALTGVQQTVVGGLQSRGVSLLPLEDLEIAGGSEIVALGKQLIIEEMEQFRLDAQAGIKFVLMRASRVLEHRELYLFGLNQTFLDIAEAYIGLPVAFDGVSIQHTIADGTEESTRIWHRDREDRRMLKIILYLNDVDGDGGPFQLLPREFDQTRKQPYLFSPEERIALDAGQFGEPVSCEGRGGTAIFADTARFFHRGKPAAGRDRSAIFFSYFAQRPQHPFFCERSGLPQHAIVPMIRDLTPRQQRAALWRTTLPLAWRLVPSAPI